MMRHNITFCLFGLMGLVFAANPALADPVAVEYTRVCTIAGQGYFYVPGTDVCLNPMTGKTYQKTEEGVVVGSSPMLMSIDRALEGVAIDAALPTAIIEPGKTFAIAGDLATFDAYNAGGFAAAVKLNENLQLNAAVGVGFTGHAGVARIGANFSW